MSLLLLFQNREASGSGIASLGAGITLCVHGQESSNDNTVLFIEGEANSGILTKDTTLFVEGIELINNNATLFVDGIGFATNTAPMHIIGEPVNSNMPLYV